MCDVTVIEGINYFSRGTPYSSVSKKNKFTSFGFVCLSKKKKSFVLVELHWFHKEKFGDWRINSAFSLSLESMKKDGAVAAASRRRMRLEIGGRQTGQ